MRAGAWITLVAAAEDAADLGQWAGEGAWLGARAPEFTYLYSATQPAVAAVAAKVAERLWLTPRFEPALNAAPRAESPARRLLNALLASKDAQPGSLVSRALLRIARAHRCDHVAVVLPARAMRAAVRDLAAAPEAEIHQLSYPTPSLCHLHLDLRAVHALRPSLTTLPGVAL